MRARMAPWDSVGRSGHGSEPSWFVRASATLLPSIIRLGDGPGSRYRSRSTARQGRIAVGKLGILKCGNADDPSRPTRHGTSFSVPTVRRPPHPIHSSPGAVAALLLASRSGWSSWPSCTNSLVEDDGRSVGRSVPRSTYCMYA